jgi:hypothetical protein
MSPLQSFMHYVRLSRVLTDLSSGYRGMNSPTVWI